MATPEKSQITSTEGDFYESVIDGIFKGETSLSDTVLEITEQGQYDLAVFMNDNPFAREAIKEESDHPSQTMALLAIALEICTHGGS